MNLLELTKQLISIPSYVEGNNDESRIGEFIYQYLKTNTRLRVVKQKLSSGGSRANIIAYTKDCNDVNTLFLNHIDTVQPKKGWNTNQFSPEIIDGKLYGLGAIDTKGNVAVLMKLAEKIHKGKIMFLFYVDEEYNFLGMRKFIQEYKNKLGIKRAISADGEGLSIRHACRGLIEMDIQCFGITGHSAKINEGVNAIIKFNRIVSNLDEYLKNFPDDDLGYSSLNLAYIKGGLALNRNTDASEAFGSMNLGRNGNNIADYCEGVVEIRTNTHVSFQRIKTCLQKLEKIHGVKLKISCLRHNLKAWKTDVSTLSLPEDFVKNYANARNAGYFDIGMLHETFRCPAMCIGAIGGNAHGPNEYVEIASLYRLYNLLKRTVLFTA